MRNRLKIMGFTLIETAVVVGIAGIVTAAALPSFTAFVTKTRLTTIANEFVGALGHSRSESVRRGIPVTIMPNIGLSTTWDGGWQAFADVNGNGTFDGNPNTVPCITGKDCLLKTRAALPTGYTLRSSTTKSMTYMPTGIVQALATDTFSLVNSASSSTTPYRSIGVSAAGHAATVVVTPTGGNSTSGNGYGQGSGWGKDH